MNKTFFIFLFIFLLLRNSYVNKLKDTNFVRFFDVGQGDSTYIHYLGKTVLIDTGVDSSVSYKLSGLNLMSCDINSLFISHWDSDHAGGIPRTFDNCSVANTYVSTTPSEHLSDVFVDSKAYTILSQGDVLSDKTAYYYILWPPKSYSCSDVNKCSLVVLIDLGEIELLFLGDLPVEEQTRMLAETAVLLDSKIDGNLDFVKTSHHGAKNGLYKGIFEKYAVKNCIISVGDNTYGHPNTDVVKYLMTVCTSVYRTDLDSDIIFDLK